MRKKYNVYTFVYTLSYWNFTMQIRKFIWLSIYINLDFFIYFFFLVKMWNTYSKFHLYIVFPFFEISHRRNITFINKFSIKIHTWEEERNSLMFERCFHVVQTRWSTNGRGGGLYGSSSAVCQPGGPPRANKRCAPPVRRHTTGSTRLLRDDY